MDILAEQTDMAWSSPPLAIITFQKTGPRSTCSSPRGIVDESASVEDGRGGSVMVSISDNVLAPDECAR